MRQPNKNIDISSFGKIPPRAVDVEMAVLGTFILDSDAYLLNPINPEIFYKDDNVIICKVIRDMSKENKKIDLITVTQRLKEKGILDEVGRAEYITQLLSGIASSAHLSAHILTLKDKYIRREIIRLSCELSAGAYDENVDLQEIVESTQSIFMKILSDETESINSFDDISLRVADKMSQNASDKTELSGLLTGFKKFDEYSYGFQPGDLVVIAGESSHGKTMLATNIITYAAKHGYPADVHSLEMSSIQLTARILASESGVPSKKILFQKMFRNEIVQVEKHISMLNGLPIYFDDKSTASSNKICASIRKMVLKFGVKIVLIDYLQLIDGDKSQGREEELGQNARMFKNLAKELNIVVILISQFSNAESHVPNMGRLRGSGQIKEAADIVLMVWMPEKEGILFIKKEDGVDIDMRGGKADIILGKGRNIGTMSFVVNCKKEINRMWDEEAEPLSPKETSNNYVPYNEPDKF